VLEGKALTVEHNGQWYEVQDELAIPHKGA
jgi:hypothetical protein